MNICHLVVQSVYLIQKKHWILIKYLNKMQLRDSTKLLLVTYNERQKERKNT